MDIIINFDCAGDVSKTITSFMENQVKNNFNKNNIFLDQTLFKILQNTVTHIFRNIADNQGYLYKKEKVLKYNNNDTMKAKMTQLLDININKQYRALAIYEPIENIGKIIDIIQESIVELSNKQNQKLKMDSTENDLDNFYSESFKKFRILEKEQREKDERVKKLLAEELITNQTPINSKAAHDLTIEEFNKKADISKSAVQLQVEYKSGNLIIADWLRVPGFEDLNVKVMKQMQHSLNDSTGRKERVKILAEEHGIVSVSVSDVGGNVFFKDDKFVFGFAKKDKYTDYINLGSVDVGLWAISVFDKDKVLEKMESLKIENPHEVLKTAITQRGLIEVSVTPGIYQLTCSGDYNSFTTDASNAGIRLGKLTGIKPLFTLVKVDLALDKKPKNKIK